MLLLLIRHGHAGECDPGRWPDDRLRPLTGDGHAAAARIAELLRNEGWGPEAILTSPWVRAAQTAEQLARALKDAGPALATEALAAPPDLDAIRAAVGIRAPDSTVALVGHSPWLDQLASLLLTGAPTRLRLDLPKGGVLAIRAGTLAPGAGELLIARH